MSYIALDKFRYYLKAIKIITKARSNALDVIDKDKDEDEDEDEVKVVDSSITTLNRKLLNVKKDGICAELGYPYGAEKKTGWANNAVVLLLIVQI